MALGNKVFVSSTCYDLIDLRADVQHGLRDMGLAPVLSDDSTSDFEVAPDKNSIETCLVNVDACDHVIFVLSHPTTIRDAKVKRGRIEYRQLRTTPASVKGTG